jgi:spore coat polysaccharide biosynthesis protein SpsF
MKRVLIIQARMGSTRLPGKVLREVAGKPMLSQQIRRLKSCSEADEIVVATTTNPADEPLVEVAHREGVSCFRGSEVDVLDRFVGAASQTKADVVVRLTADCPLIDPALTDQVIHELIDHESTCDYAANVLKRTFPRGLDVEAFFFDVLLRWNRMASSQRSREHVTLLVRSESPELFLSRSVEDTEDNSDLRWTVDTETDLLLIRKLYDELDLGTHVNSYRDLLAYVRMHPELPRLNAHEQTWSPL